MHEAMCLAAISAWLCGLRDTQEYRVTGARQAFNPLVQGSNPWGATREEPRNQAKCGCGAISVPGYLPSLTTIFTTIAM
jgi:hypothetical protein